MKSEKIHTPLYEPGITYGKPYKLDKYDHKIILELDENARKPLSEISKKVGLSRDAVRNRIKKLVDNKVILAFKPIFNPPNLGYPIINYVCISLYNPDEKQEKAISGADIRQLTTPAASQSLAVINPQQQPEALVYATFG